MTTTATRSPRGGAAARGAFLGFLIDNFDIYLPIVALAPAIAFFIPSTLDPGTAALVSSWIFVATLLGRPLGAVIFGYLGDVIGRRRSTIIAIAGFSVMTAIIGLLPGYEDWGLGAVVALIVLRFLDGVFLGGEYSGANVLAMEESAKHRRGLVGGFIQMGATAAFVLMSLLTLGVFGIAAPGGLDSAYTQWGWRIPFLVGAAIGIAFVFYYAATVRESSVWESDKSARRNRRETASAFDILRGSAGRALLQVFVLMSGLWFLLNAVTALLPGVLARTVKLQSSQVTLVLVVMYAVLTLWFPLGGLLSQRIGRRGYFIGSSILVVVLGIPAYALLITSTGGSFALAMLFSVLAALFIVAPWAVIVPYLSERFQTSNRAAGYGLGYSLAVVIPAFYASYQAGLATLMPPQFTVLVLIAIGALLVLVGALVGPETRDTDFQATVNVAAASAQGGRITAEKENAS